MTKSYPRVTVIMIVLNGEKLISHSIESVLGQTYEDWSLLVVDDGSTDGTTSIVEQFIADHPDRIRHTRHPDKKNHGMSASRSLGIRESESPFLIFLDHDDLLDKNALSEMVEALEAHPEAAAVYGPSTRFWTNPDGNPTGEPDELQVIGTDTDRIAHPPGILPVVLRTPSTAPLAPLLRREAVLSIGGYESSFRGMYEDQAFLTKLCMNYPIYIDSRSWVRYRQHLDSCVYTSFRNGSNTKKRRVFLMWAKRQLAQSPMYYPQIHAYLERELATVNGVLRRRTLTLPLRMIHKFWRRKPA